MSHSTGLSTYREIQRVSTMRFEFCEVCHEGKLFQDDLTTILLTFLLGIPYSDVSFLCPECGMIICKNCHPIHEESHLRKILRFRSMQWMATLPGVAASVSCFHCALETKVRWQCEKCDSALCRRCAGNFERRDEFIKDHQTKNPDHRSFLALYPPYWTAKQKWIQDKCSCSDVLPVTAMHCDRCHNGMHSMRQP